MPAITYWLMGSLNSAGYDSLLLGAPLILAGIAGASDRSVAVCEVVAVAGERIAELPGKYAVRYAADFIPAGLRTVESNTTNRTGVAASAN